MGRRNGTPPRSDQAGRVRSVAGRRWPAENSTEEGSAIIETALILPIIFVLMTGIFSFSIALYQKLELAQAVGSGARFLGTDRGDTDPCAATASRIYATAPTLTKSKISLTFVLDGTSYSGATCSGTTHMITGKTAQITATYPCVLSAYGMSFSSCSLSESISEVLQ